MTFPTVRFRVAPYSNRSGVVLAEAHGQWLLLLIAPKVWPRHASSGATSQVHRISIAGEYSVHEGDSIELVGDVACLAGQLVAVSDRADQRQDECERTAGMLVDAEAKQHRASLLFARVEGRRAAAPATPLSPSAPAVLSNLLALALLADRVKKLHASDGVSAVVDTADQSFSIVDANETNPVVDVALAWQYVELVERHVRDLRRGYLVQSDKLAVVRGRILDRGLAHWHATGGPQLECEFDEFSELLPVFLAIVAALEVVASTGLTGLVRFSRWPLCGDLVAKAGRIRQYLHAIPSVPRRSAAKMARQIRLPRSHAMWQAPLDAARRILEARPPQRDRDAQRQDFVLAWYIDTPRLWELVLHHALANRHDVVVQSKFGKPQSQNDWARTYAPWHAQGVESRKTHERQPDLLWWRGDRLCVCDAKYKVADGKISSADQYQLFTYSHLTEHPGRHTVACAVLYPAAPGVRVQERKFIRNGGSGPKCTLDLLVLPFPTAKVVVSDATWRAYLVSVGDAIVVAVGETVGLHEA